MTPILATLLSTMVAVGQSLAEQDDPSDIAVAPDGVIKYSRRAYEAGRRDAQRDLHEGQLAFEVYGGPPPACDAAWKKMLAETYHIDVREVAGCVVDYRIVGHARGYNDVSGAEIDRKFGGNFIRRSRDEFCDQWQAAHK